MVTTIALGVILGGIGLWTLGFVLSAIALWWENLEYGAFARMAGVALMTATPIVGIIAVYLTAP